MSSKKYKNLSFDELNRIRTMDYSELKKLNSHFNKTKADSGFLTKFGAYITLILAIPALIFSFYMFATGIITLVESSAYMISPETGLFVNQSGLPFIVDWFIPQYNAIVTSINGVDMTSILYIGWNVETTLPADASLSTQIDFLVISIMIAVPFLVFSWYIVTTFIKVFQVAIGKANNRNHVVRRTIVVLGIATFIFFMAIFGFNAAADEPMFAGDWATIDRYLITSGIYLLIMFVLGVVPMRIGKYKLNASLYINSKK